MNHVNLVGRLTKDPDVHGNGDFINVRFTTAVNRKFKNKDGKYDADFINCVAFGKTAEFIEKFFRKGMAIGIGGEIRTGSYTNRDGQKVFTTEVYVNDAEFVESKGASGQQSTQAAVPPPGQYQPKQNYQAPPQQQPVQPQYQQAPPVQYQQPQQQYQQAPPQYQQPQAQPMQQPVYQQSDPDWMKIPEGSGDTLPFN